MCVTMHYRLVSLQNTSTSLAALSLSSPTISHTPITPAANGTQQHTLPIMTSIPITTEDVAGSADDKTLVLGGNGNIARTGRKRGTVFTCESCSKVCLYPQVSSLLTWSHF